MNLSHDDSILSLGVLTDSLIITGSRDCSIKVWDQETGELVRTFLGHQTGVSTLATVLNSEHKMSSKKYRAHNRINNLLKAENNLILSGSEFPSCNIFVWALDYNPPLE